MRERELFHKILEELDLLGRETVEKFDCYFDLLIESNAKINLISRQTKYEDYWLLHFADSVLPMVKGLDLSSKTLLDLGTGGGLPGIPLAILNPDSKVCMLDSKPKKILEVNDFIKKLDLVNSFTTCKRLEEIKENDEVDGLKFGSGFDVILSRSVKVSYKLLKRMSSFLKADGYILLYKGREFEESGLDVPMEIISCPESFWGERNLVKIEKI